MTSRIVADAFCGVTLQPLTTPFTTDVTCCRPEADWVRMPSTVRRNATWAAFDVEPDPLPFDDPEPFDCPVEPCVVGAWLEPLPCEPPPVVVDATGDFDEPPPKTSAATSTATTITSTPTAAAKTSGPRREGDDGAGWCAVGPWPGG